MVIIIITNIGTYTRVLITNKFGYSFPLKKRVEPV